jgi:6-pyruvoyltetrahydropterin/6-carboxytetrahydropterin synthase
LARAARGGELGQGATGLSSICVTLNESHVAWGSYEGKL